MGSSNTSVGRGPAHGGNENHDGDPLNKTFGETVKEEPPAGNDLILEQEEQRQPSTKTPGELPSRKG
ncbi:hypothetical protein [Caenimonas soli]|uniref:hypothetical protein n=1 Tax=Caenimonas soli TaxID=2735555 RepID=UPI001555CEBA|nr:hypothetical protein [Caenimonas soli]NPC54088.1 hypothetical protein [Caenimonas soli]